MLRATTVAVLVSLALATAGCAGRSAAPGTSLLPQTSDGSHQRPHTTTAPIKVIVIVPLTGSKPPLSAHYVSAGTRSILMKVTADGNKSKAFAFNLTPTTNRACVKGTASTTCTLVAQMPPDDYTGLFETYDGLVDIHGDPGGKELSANLSIPVHLGSKGTTVKISAALQGIPATLRFVPAVNSGLTGSANTGYTFGKCMQAQTVAVLGVDLAGYYILGQGQPAATLTSANPSELSVAKASINTFVLTRAISNSQTTTSLKATLTPSLNAGGTVVSATIPFTLAGGTQICGVFHEYAIPTTAAKPQFITAGGDGAMWFTEYQGNKIGRVDSSGSVTEMTIPTANSRPLEIALGPDGAVWFTESNANKIGRFYTSFKEFAIPTASSAPYGIIAGPNDDPHSLWFTETATDKLGRISSSDQITEYPQVFSGTLLAAGVDGALWITDQSGYVDRVDTLGNQTNTYNAPSVPYGIVAGPDGGLWFTNGDGGSSYIDRISYAGVVTKRTTFGSAAVAPGIAVGADSNIWFSDIIANKIARLTTSNVRTEWSIPTATSGAYGMASGPDGSMWFTECLGNKIGRFQ